MRCVVLCFRFAFWFSVNAWCLRRWGVSFLCGLCVIVGILLFGLCELCWMLGSICVFVLELLVFIWILILLILVVVRWVDLRHLILR